MNRCRTIASVGFLLLLTLSACGTTIPVSLVVESPDGSLVLAGLIPIPQFVNDDDECRTLEDFFDGDCDDECSLGDFLRGDDDCDD